MLVPVCFYTLAIIGYFAQLSPNLHGKALTSEPKEGWGLSDDNAGDVRGGLSLGRSA